MFPLNSNDSYIKSTGERSTLGRVIEGGGTSPIPSHTAEDAGKVLTVGEDGSLEWDEKGAGGGYWFDKIRPMLCYPTVVNNVVKVEYGGFPNPPSDGADLSHGYTTNTSRTFPLTECIDFSISNCIELQSYLTDPIISALNATLLGSLTTADDELELSASILDYDVLILQGCYTDGGAGSRYDTSILYLNPEINKSYWFGVRDRNASYSGNITFSDGTHATLSASRRIKVYGMNL